MVDNSGIWSIAGSGVRISLDQVCCSGQNVLNNSGTLGKAGNGQVSVGWAVNNNSGGTVAVNAGTLTLGGGGGTPSIASGVSYVANGTLEVGGGSFDIESGSLSGTGSVKASSGTLTLGTSSNNGSLNFNVAGRI